MYYQLLSFKHGAFGRVFNSYPEARESLAATIAEEQGYENMIAAHYNRPAKNVKADFTVIEVLTGCKGAFMASL